MRLRFDELAGGIECDAAGLDHARRYMSDRVRRCAGGDGHITGMERHVALLDAFGSQGAEGCKVLGKADAGENLT